MSVLMLSQKVVISLKKGIHGFLAV